MPKPNQLSSKLFSQKITLFMLLNGLTVLLSTTASAQIAPNTNQSWANTQNGEVSFDVMVSSHSPTLAIDAFINDWDAPLDSGSMAYIQGRVGMQFTPVKSNTDDTESALNTQTIPNLNLNQGTVSYGVGWRYDYLMSFSDDTAQVYWRYENKQNPPSNTHYPLLLEAMHSERIGANIGYTLPILTHLQDNSVLSDWRITAKANLWQGKHVLDGIIAGDMYTRDTVLSAQDKIRDSIDTVQANIDYYYDKPALGEEDIGWNVGSPDGYGYSFDVALRGKINADTSLSLAGYDLLGRMHWQDISSTQYLLDYDVMGRPLYTLKGQLAHKDVTQTLPWRAEGSLRHQLDDDWQLGLTAQANDVDKLYQLSAGYQFNNKHLPALVKDLAITGLFEPKTDALGVALDSRYGGLKFLTDDLDSKKSKRAEVSLYGRYSW